MTPYQPEILSHEKMSRCTLGITMISKERRCLMSNPNKSLRPRENRQYIRFFAVQYTDNMTLMSNIKNQ